MGTIGELVGFAKWLTAEGETYPVLETDFCKFVPPLEDCIETLTRMSSMLFEAKNAFDATEAAEFQLCYSKIEWWSTFFKAHPYTRPVSGLLAETLKSVSTALGKKDFGSARSKAGLEMKATIIAFAAITSATKKLCPQRIRSDSESPFPDESAD